MKGRPFLFCMGILLLSYTAYSQVSPPGLGAAKAASWFAFGLKQRFGRSKKWQSMSYIGMGRKSNPDNDAPFLKPAIWVLNQEFYHQFHPNWQYSMALSYRKQNEYNDDPPYGQTQAGYKREWRLYGRMAYSRSSERLKFTTTLRQELRTFVHPLAEAAGELLQLRSRLKFQLAVNLDKRKIHRLIAGYESLFSVSRIDQADAWTPFRYQESRFTLYYAVSPLNMPFTIDLGYMNDLVGFKSPYSVHYLALDVVFNNPLGLFKKGESRER